MGRCIIYGHCGYFRSNGKAMGEWADKVENGGSSMSASSLSLPFLVPNTSPRLPREISFQSRTKIAPSQIIRRRPTMQQGRALEILGHAIEYLIDSRMFLVNEPHTSAEAAAVQVLFAEQP